MAIQQVGTHILCFAFFSFVLLYYNPVCCKGAEVYLAADWRALAEVCLNLGLGPYISISVLGCALCLALDRDDCFAHQSFSRTLLTKLNGVSCCKEVRLVKTRAMSLDMLWFCHRRRFHPGESASKTGSLLHSFLYYSSESSPCANKSHVG